MRFAVLPLLLAIGCSSSSSESQTDASVDTTPPADSSADVVCPDGEVTIYAAPGCGGSIVPTCEPPADTGCVTTVCGCDGKVHVYGCEGAHDPFQSKESGDRVEGEACGDAGVVKPECCPISEMPACCMAFGGVKTDGSSCGTVCDNIPTGLVKKVDDAGCPYWYAPPGAPITCGVGLDTGVATDADASD
jgi:hypothetical protein